MRGPRMLGGIASAVVALGDGKIQLRHSEAAVYRFTRNGRLRLSALEHLATRQAWRVHHPT